MIHQEPTGAFKAGFLLALGSVFGLVGLVLSAGTSAVDRAALPDAPPALVGILVWGPVTLIAAGGTLAAVAAAVLYMGWFQKRS